MWNIAASSPDLWKRITYQRWPSLASFLKSHVIFGNWKQLYKTRAQALVCVDHDCDFWRVGIPPIQEFIFTLELWCEGDDIKTQNKKARNDVATKTSTLGTMTIPREVIPYHPENALLLQEADDGLCARYPSRSLQTKMA